MVGGILETPVGFTYRTVVECEEVVMTGETVVTMPAPDVRVELPGGFAVDADHGRFDLGRVYRRLSTDVY